MAFSFGRPFADRPSSRCVSRLHACGARSSRLRDTPAPVHARQTAFGGRGRFAQPCGPRSRGTAALDRRLRTDPRPGASLDCTPAARARAAFGTRLPLYTHGEAVRVGCAAASRSPAGHAPAAPRH